MFEVAVVVAVSVKLPSFISVAHLPVCPTTLRDSTGTTRGLYGAYVTIQAEVTTFGTGPCEDIHAFRFVWLAAF